MVGSDQIMTHVFEHSAKRLSNNCASQMTNVHFFGNVWWREVNYNLLLWNLGEMKALDKFVNFRFDKLILDSDLQESFFIGFNGSNDIVFKEVFYNFFSKLYDSFASKSSSFFFIFVHVKLFHGVWRDIFTFVFGTVLQCNFAFNTWEGFSNDFFESVLDKSGDKFGLGLHL